MNFIAHTYILILTLNIFSFCLEKKHRVSILSNEELIQKRLKYNTTAKTFEGWWIYGEGYHLFKDQNTLAEYDLEFPNENAEELKSLYLAVCEMEYFPMECKMTGYLIKKNLENQKTLIVSDFEIIYIQGCED